jgi:hypothetical protein
MRLIFYKEENAFVRLTESPFSPDAEYLAINLQMKTCELLISSVFPPQKRRKTEIQISANSEITSDVSAPLHLL